MIDRATTPADFAEVARLMQALRALDEAESAKLGVPPEAVAVYYTNRSATALAARFLAPDAAMFVLRDGGTIAGCGGLVQNAPGIAELRHVFVDPALRGRGHGAALIARLIDEARLRGFRELRLETAVFLTAAIALYHRLGFRDVPPFAPEPAGLQGLSVFMTLDL